MSETGSIGNRKDINEFIRRLLENFFKTTKFSRVSINDLNTSVEVKFEREKMEIRNLQDFYPFMSFDLIGSGNNIVKLKISYSQNGYDWNVLDDTDMTNQLEIFLLYHPIFILTNTKFEIKTDYIPSEIEGIYFIEDLPFHADVKQFFKENNENMRTVRILHDNEQLIRMTQKDFPPFNDQVSLKFSGY
jgi:hypothetical protein